MENLHASKETVVWKSKPSQWMNLSKCTFYFFMGIFWLLIPGLFKDDCLKIHIIGSITVISCLYFYSLFMFVLTVIPIIQLSVMEYEFTSERLFVTSGVLKRVREEIELYRIKDYKIVAPLFIRLFSLSNVYLYTSDMTLPVLILSAIKDGPKIVDLLRENVEKSKSKRGYIQVE